MPRRRSKARLRRPELKSAHEKLTQASHKLAEAMYKADAAAPGRRPDGSTGGGKRRRAEEGRRCHRRRVRGRRRQEVGPQCGNLALRGGKTSGWVATSCPHPDLRCFLRGLTDHPGGKLVAGRFLLLIPICSLMREALHFTRDQKLPARGYRADFSRPGAKHGIQAAHAEKLFKSSCRLSRFRKFSLRIWNMSGWALHRLTGDAEGNHMWNRESERENHGSLTDRTIREGQERLLSG